MSNAEQRALQNAAASSAMEGLPLEKHHFEVIQNILEEKMSLQDYLQSLKNNIRRLEYGILYCLY